MVFHGLVEQGEAQPVCVLGRDRLREANPDMGAIAATRRFNRTGDLPGESGLTKRSDRRLPITFFDR